MFETVQFRIADVDVSIDAPREIIDIAKESYRRLPSTEGRAEAHALVHAELDAAGTLRIRIGQIDYADVPAGSGRGVVGIELSNAVITAVAQRSRFVILHAAALEMDGEALCIAAPGYSGKTLLASHLVSRGWRILSDEYAFIEPMTGNVVPFQKLLFMRSSSLPHTPRSFKKSIEASPWYGLGNAPGLVFSGVDPASSYSESVWSTGARLTRLLLLSGKRAPSAVIDECETWNLIPDLNALVWQSPDLLTGLQRLAMAVRGTSVGRLTAASPLATADAIERWAMAQARAHSYA